MKVNKCKYDECGLEYYPKHKFGKSEYCSDLCKSRASQKRQNKQAKIIGCISCGKDFARKGAKDLRCQVCRDNIKLGEKKSSGNVKYPKTERESEVAMIDDWIKKNKVKEVI